VATNVYTRTFLDVGDGTAGSAGDGVSQPGEPGLPLVATNVRYRDGSFGFFNNTDLDGYAGFNEVFPFLNWLVVETDTRASSRPARTSSTMRAVPPTPSVAPLRTASRMAWRTASNRTLSDRRAVPGARYCAHAHLSGGRQRSLAPQASQRSCRSAGNTTEGWQGLLGRTASSSSR